MQIFTSLAKEQRLGFKEIDIDQLKLRLKTIDEKASIMLHHDAITSTSPVGTLNDYMSRTREVMNLIQSEEVLLEKVFKRNPKI